MGAETEGERWSERTAIITRLDHEEYARYAGEFVSEIVGGIRTPERKKNDAEEEKRFGGGGRR